MGDATPTTNQVLEINLVVEVVQTPRIEDGLQNANPLKRFHETHIGKLLVYPSLPTHRCRRPKPEVNRN